jgi:putative peptidoglycan lipid II flippase
MARSATIVMVAFILSRALGLVREMIIGSQFGTSGELDAYLAAFRIPDLIFQLVAGGALGSAFIPIFNGYLARGDEGQAWRVASAIFNLVLVILTVLAVGFAIFADPLVSLIAPGFDPATHDLAVQLTRIMLLSPILAGLSGIVMGILNSYQHFTLPALAPALYNLGIIIGAVFLGPLMGVTGLAIGVVIGIFLHLGIQVPELVRRGLTSRYRFVLGVAHPGVREIGRLMLPRMLGLAAVQVNFLVNTILASGLSSGSLSAMNYAWLLMMLPQGVFAMAISTVAFPTLSELATTGNMERFRATLSGALRMILFLTIPATVGLVVLREPIIQLLLQRGRFDAASTDAVAWALQFYAIGLFAHASIEILTRGFYALHDTRTPVSVAVGAMILNVVLSLILIGPLSFGGLALANAIAAIVELIGLGWLLGRRLEGIGVRKVMASALRMVLAAGVMGAVTVWVTRWLPESNVVVLTAGAVVAGAATYFLCTLALRSPEIASLNLVIRRYLSRSP